MRIESFIGTKKQFSKPVEGLSTALRDPFDGIPLNVLVVRYQHQVFDHGLGDQHAMLEIHALDPYGQSLSCLRNRELAGTALGGDFPKGAPLKMSGDAV